MASSEEVQGKEVEEKDEKGEVQKKQLVDKAKERIASFFAAKWKEEEEEKKGRRS